MTKTIRVGSARDWISLFQTRSLGIKWITAVLAFVTVFQVARNWRRARPLVWLFNVFGTLDLICAIVLATIYRAPVFMGPAYWIPAFWVPALLVTHYITFVGLTKYWKGNLQ